MEMISKSKQELIEKFNSSDPLTKNLLIEIYGKEIFKTPIIRNWDWVLEKNGMDQQKFDQIVHGRLPHEIALKQMEMISFAYNDGEIPEWENKNQKKWFPVHYYDEAKAGFVFDASHCRSTAADAGLGPRLCFFEQEHSDEAGKEFAHIYGAYLKRQ